MKKIIKKSIIGLFLITFIYTVSLFIAPLTLEPHTVEDLDGNANMIDYSDKWKELPLYHNIVYTFSDFNCHQKASRSYFINDNQMPVCARDVGIFVGLSLGFFFMSFAESDYDYKNILLKILHIDTSISEKKKIAILIIVGALFVLPIALDGGIQLVTYYESNNPLRTVTGLIFGIGFSVFISSLLLSVIPITNQKE
ncbi:MAG: DUF2085 domain-containing protein [Thermoplasmatota archaeon]